MKVNIPSSQEVQGYTEEQLNTFLNDFPIEKVQKIFDHEMSHLIKYLRVTTWNTNFFVKITDNSKNTTACMYIEKGNMEIDKKFFLKNYLNIWSYNINFLDWIPRHENNHYIDMTSVENKDWSFPQNLGKYASFMEEIATYLESKYGENKELAAYLVHRFFNAIDDIYVNKLIESQSAQYQVWWDMSDKIYSLYREVLFPLMDFWEEWRMRLDSFGDYLLNMVMRPKDTLWISEDLAGHVQSVKPDIYKWIDFQNREWASKKTITKTYYWAKRYVDFYKPKLWPIVKELLDKDMELIRQNAELHEKIREFIEKNWSPHNFEGPNDHSESGKWIYYFKNKAWEAKDNQGKARKSQRQEMERNQESKEWTKSPDQKSTESSAKAAALQAKTLGININNSLLFGETIKTQDKQIERMAKAILNLLTLDIEYIEETVLESRKTKGSLNVSHLIDDLAQLFDRSSWKRELKVFEKKYILEVILPKIKDIFLRFLIDNSWSMKGLLQELKQNIIVFLAAFERVKNRFKDEQIDTVSINVGVMKYWNDASFVQKTKNIFERSNDSQFRDDTLIVLDSIDASEWTNNAVAWSKAWEDLKPNELGPNSTSIFIDITDWYTATESETTDAVRSLQNKWVNTFSIIILNATAMDKSAEDLLDESMKKLLDKDKNQRLTPQESVQLHEAIHRAKIQWKSENEKALADNPASRIWWDRTYPIKSAWEMLPTLLFILTDVLYRWKLSDKTRKYLHSAISSNLSWVNN